MLWVRLRVRVSGVVPAGTGPIGFEKRRSCDPYARGPPTQHRCVRVRVRARVGARVGGVVPARTGPIGFQKTSILRCIELRRGPLSPNDCS